MIFIGYFDSIYSTDLPHRAKAVYMYLHDRANTNGQCWPAIPTIAKELQLSRSTVQRALKDLEEHGFLARERRWRKSGGKSSNLYTLLKYQHASAKE